MVAHDLIAAIAGDEEAREKIRSLGPGSDAIPGPDSIPLADEFLILDTDASQNYAINAVLGGENLIVRGPPGTGKSQTIANLIAALVARGKKVLFVAEKRAAIDAVLKRLHQQKLDELVLDLHGGVGSRKAFAQTIGHALGATRTVPRIDNASEQRIVERRRSELSQYVQALHEPRDPWGISLYEIRAELLGTPEWAHTEIRFPADVLSWLTRRTVTEVEEELAEFARLGGLSLPTSDSPWRDADIQSTDEVQGAWELLEQVRRHALPSAVSALRSAAGETGFPTASTVADWQKRLELWSDVAGTLSFFAEEIFERDLDGLWMAMAPAAAGGLSRLKASLFSGEYRSARTELRDLSSSSERPPDRELLYRAEASREQLRRLLELGAESPPAVPPNLGALQGACDQLLAELDQLQEVVKDTDLGNRPIEELEALLDHLAADRSTLVILPELHRLSTSFREAGLADFVDRATAREASEEACVRGFHYAWLRSLLDHLALSDAQVEGFIAEKHEKAVDEFKRGDRDHIETTAGRVRRVCAEQATAARDTYRDQSQLLEHQAALKRRHLPVRDLVRATSDALLALKPCWAMSPLVVSQLLPAQTYFDAVIFDEASQITPADAVSSIVRGRTLVVAGDEHQLPPTAFFVAEAPEDDEESEEAEPVPLVAGTTGFESILDALGSLLRFRMLRWHYRSRDERLIAFSNAHIYDRQLTTFPGIGEGEVLRHVLVDWDPAADTNSPAPEVERVVDLITEHALDRPDESLGVIAMGIKHASRIEEGLRERLREDSELAEELAEFFDEEREERFFVKNLERVQGDERDAIILSIGYGKNSRGQLVYRFGPLLYEGGERRLNVAVTRAKKRLALVSSFSHRDMDPERSSAQGMRLIRQYLQYVESGGENLGDRVFEKPPLNPFEVDVRDTLTRQGLKLAAQYGSSGYWIDFAVQDPVQPGRFVLAIECDGASYHSSESARDRDRLRQEQLERIGWRFHRIWSSEWFHNKEKAVAKVLAAYRETLKVDRKAAETDGSDIVAHADPMAGDSRETPAELIERAAGPRIRRGLPIDVYSNSELVSLARWIKSDELLRTEDELVTEMMRELGFQRRGSKIVRRLTAAIRGARR